MTPDLDHIGRLSVTLHWRVKKQLVFFYEVPTDVLAAKLPPELELQEVRPGVALAALEMLQYKTDHFRPGYPEFYEAVFAAVVQPDLSIDMPVPRFNMFAMTVISDSQEFCDSEATTLFTPTTLVPGLRIDFDEAGSSCSVWDGETKLADCRSSAPETPTKPLTIWGQYFTNGNRFERGAWRWDGAASEHMKPGERVPFAPHMLWNGIAPADVGRVYRQMAASPDTTDIRFFHAGPAEKRAAH